MDIRDGTTYNPDMTIAYVIAGMVAGALHVVTGPDHLAAVSPLAVIEKRRAWRSGLQWAIGHTSGVLVIGVVGLFLRQIVPIESLSGWSEYLVGWVLIGIGLWGFHSAWKPHFHSHTHSHGDVVHEHIHAHGSRHTHRHFHAAVWIGMLHGLAGGSHVVGVMPALILPNLADASMYLISFGAGTIGAMTLCTSTIGLLSSRFQNLIVFKSLLVGASCVAVVVGTYWLLGY